MKSSATPSPLHNSLSFETGRMSLRFWSNAKPVSTMSSVQVDDLSWFESSIHDGVVILGIFRDAIALSSSSYVKSIAKQTLSIIQGIATVGISDASLRHDFHKLGEATAAVTATILQSYLESTNRGGWPGPQLQGILEDSTTALNTIEVWISSEQAKNSFGRRKRARIIKQFQERLSEVLERFQLNSLLRSYAVLPFIKEVVEEYAHDLDAGDGQSCTMMPDDLSKALPESGLPEQDNLSGHRQRQGKAKDTSDSLRVNVRLVLQIIEKDGRSQSSSSDVLATNQVATEPHRYPREQKLHELQDSREKLVSGDDKMEQHAEEMLYDILMTRLSNVAIFGPNPSPLTVERSKISLSSLPPIHAANNSQGQNADQRPTPTEIAVNVIGDNPSERESTNHRRFTVSMPPNRLDLEKPLPFLELADTFRPQTHHGYIAHGMEVDHAHGQNGPLNQKGSRGSLPPGAMPPVFGSASLLSLLARGNGVTNSRPLSATRSEQSLGVIPLLDSKEGIEGEESPIPKKNHTFSPEVKEPSRPSLSDVDRKDQATASNQPIPNVTLPISRPPPSDDTGKEKTITGATLSVDWTRVPPTSTEIKIPCNSPPLPPGAMPPKLSSWLPSEFGKVKEGLPGHRLRHDPTANMTAPLSSINPVESLPPVMPSNSSSGRLPDQSDGALLAPATNCDISSEDSTTYNLPPVSIPSPIVLPPLLVVESESSRILSLPSPRRKRPKSLGSGYEYLRKMSPHMQRYIESLADRVWGEVGIAKRRQ